MIVTCDACQTRFRIPDEKVTEKGVKVRCTRCQNTFRVSRPPPPLPGPFDAPAPPVVPSVLPVSSAPAAAPAAPAPFDPFAAFGPRTEPGPQDATRPLTIPPSTLARLAEPPPSVPALAPPPAEPPAVPGFFEPRGEPSDFGAGDDPFSEPTRMVANPLAASRPPPLPPASPSLDAHDPFALLGDPGSSSETTGTFPGIAPAPPQDPFAGLGSPFPPSDPFAREQPDAGFEGTAPGFEGTQPGYPAEQGPGFGELSSPGFGFPGSFSDGSPAPAPAEADRSLFEAGSGGFDPGAASSGMDRGMFEMPSQQPGAGGLLGDLPPAADGLDAAPDEVTATGVISPAPPPPAPPEPPPASAAVKTSAPEQKPEPVPEKKGGLFRSFWGAVGNIFAAVVLLSVVAVVAAVYLNGGRVDLSTLTAGNLKTLWSHHDDVVTRDVSNGLYDTHSGHPVLYVRGFVENHTARAGKVKVTAAIYDGDQLLRPASVYAGKSPTPEDLAAIAGQGDVDALVARLNAEAQVVGPGARVPFLVPFYEYPSDLTGLRLKVTADSPEPAEGKPAARSSPSVAAGSAAPKPAAAKDATAPAKAPAPATPAAAKLPAPAAKP